MQSGKYIRITHNETNINLFTAMGAIILAIVVISPLVNLYLLGLLIMPISVIIYRAGIQIDPSRKRFRKFKFVYTYFDYSWEWLDNYTHVGLRPVKLAYSQLMPTDMALMTGSFTYAESTQEVELFFWSESRKKMVLKRGGLKKLYPLAMKLSEALDYELYMHQRLGIK